MKSSNLLVLATTLLSQLPLAQASWAAATSDCLRDGFLPKNSMKISVMNRRNSMNEKRFNEIISRVESFYQPIAAKQGASLTFEREWTDDTVNAYASRNGNQWIISMYGGLARHEAITEDGFALVACHEVGHHLGGAPKYRGQWAANEGQADYFGTLKCLRNIFLNDDNVSIVKGLNVPRAVIRSCEASYGDSASIALCERSAMAGRSTAELMRVLNNASKIDFTTPDPAQVSSTSDAHPAAQCRLDTYFSGAVCQVSKDEALSDTDATVGTCSEERNFKIGVRPRCWYKPESSGNPDPNPTPSPTPAPSPGDIAAAPLLAGKTQLFTRNPYAAIPVDYDVSGFKQSGGVYFEISSPNRPFSKPNGELPDSVHSAGFLKAGTRGRISVLPAQNLPGWGTYQIRVIPVDRQGQKAVGRFSNSSTLIISP